MASSGRYPRSRMETHASGGAETPRRLLQAVLVARASDHRPLARAGHRALGDHAPRRRLVRDDRRAPLRAPRDQYRPAALAAAARPRRPDPEREPALPAADRAGLRARIRAGIAALGAHPERVHHDLGGGTRFLLARSVHRRSAAYFVALLSVCVPWIVFSSFLLTEVVAYPAFLWAMLALQRATVTPRIANDVLALLGIALATLARTQFFVLVLVLGARDPAPRDRLRGREPLEIAPSRRLPACARRPPAAGGLLRPADGGGGRALGVRQALERGRHIRGGRRGQPVSVELHPLAGRACRNDRARPGGAAVRDRRGLARRRPRRLVVEGASCLLGARDADLLRARRRGDVVRSSLRRRSRCASGTSSTSFRSSSLRSLERSATAAGRAGHCSSLLPVILYGFWHSGLKHYEKLNIDTPVSMLERPAAGDRSQAGGGRNGSRAGGSRRAGPPHRAHHPGRRHDRPDRALRRSLVPAPAVVPRGGAGSGHGGRAPLETRYAFERLFAVNGTAGRPLTSTRAGSSTGSTARSGPKPASRWFPIRPVPATSGPGSASGGTWSSGTSPWTARCTGPASSSGRRAPFRGPPSLRPENGRCERVAGAVRRAEQQGNAIPDLRRLACP